MRSLSSSRESRVLGVAFVAEKTSVCARKDDVMKQKRGGLVPI